jgi:hypothetical protein
VVLIDDLQDSGQPGYPSRDELRLPGYRLEELGAVARLSPGDYASRA